MGKLISNPAPPLPSVGPITVSSNGVSNGLSDFPNDGADFGSDTMLGATSKDQYGPPYTQTAGIQEALNYAASIAIYNAYYEGYILPPIKLLEGYYPLNVDVVFPYFSNVTHQIPVFTLSGEGSGFQLPTGLGLNGHNIIIGNSSDPSSGSQTPGGGFLIEKLTFYAGNNGSMKFFGNFEGNPNCILRDLGINSMNIDMSGANSIAQLNLDNVLLYGDSKFLSPTTSYQISITNGTFKGGFYSNGVNQIGAVNFAEGIQINSGDPNFAFNVWEIDNNGTENVGNNGITNGTASGTTSNMTIDVGALVINTSTAFFNSTGSNGTLNLKLHVKHLVFQGDIMDFSIPSGSNINIQEFTVDEITNNTSSDISTANLPILSTTSGTTAGTVSMRFTEYSSSHKKLIITVFDYQNDTTTDQVINYPMPFNTSTVLTGNNTSLGIPAVSLTSITISSPNNTTGYGGVIILEGY